MDNNAYWYLGLVTISILLIIYTYLKTRTPRVLLLFIAVIGLGYIIEAVIYNLLDSYRYYPKILKHNPYYDSNLGAVASNAFALPALATYISVFRTNWVWMLFFVALIHLIEWFFLKLHIYSHNWWNSWFTSFGLPFYFISAKFLYQKLLKPMKGFMHSLTLFLMVGPFSGMFHITPIMIFSNRYYQFGLFENQYQDTTAFAAIYYLCASFLYVLMTKIQWRTTWMKYLTTVICFAIITFLLKKAGILHIQAWWDPWYYIIMPLILLVITQSISKRLYIGPQKKMPDPL